MKKLITLVLILTFVLSICTVSLADEYVMSGVTHSTGEWEVIDDGSGVMSFSPFGILVLEKTAKLGSIEFTIDMASILAGGHPAVYLQGTGFENVTELDAAAIEAATTDSLYIWFHEYPCIAITNMNKGQWSADRQDSANDFDMYVENPNELTELTFKFEFGDGKCQGYINGIKCDKNMPFSYDAIGEQIVLRGSVATEFRNVKINGEAVDFSYKLVEETPGEQPAENTGNDTTDDTQTENTDNQKNENDESNKDAVKIVPIVIAIVAAVAVIAVVAVIVIKKKKA
ncbi:MAG: hypothetical protein IJZ03_09100 [Clostridia bacterium]|nr:hypothetical protein [Clostridia bacterium]MBQ8743507.1 hypothetical protein [Clostridia bacterium]